MNTNETAINTPVANPYYAQIPVRKEWSFARRDVAFAGISFALGLLFWDWVFVTDYAPGVGVTAFFALAAVCGGVYMRALGFRQNRLSVLCLVVMLAGSLPFALYAPTGIYPVLLLFDIAVALLWVMYTCRTSAAGHLSGYILPDLINQVFVVPFNNFPGAFRALAFGVKNRGTDRRGLHSVIGLVVSIPVIIGVVVLLMNSDARFAAVIGDIADAVNLAGFGHYLAELLIGIPVACYLFGSLFGNSHKRYTDSITKQATDTSLAAARRIPRAAVAAPLVALTAIYALFFVVMAGYLFSAFSGGLPAEYTYAEYARKGFFELLGVAAINLFIVAFVYLFARRGAGEFPRFLRALTGAVSAMTILLILTAASKMMLYVDTYGLTRPRLYTLWFMLLLLGVFAILVIWHARPFNAGRPIVLLFAVLVLCLFLGNSDGVIAGYNVDRYLTGQTDAVDTEELAEMSDAVVPYLIELKEKAPDAETRAAAGDALGSHRDTVWSAGLVYKMHEINPEGGFDHPITWRSWNAQSGTYAIPE
jgi:hypothetical protein